MEWIDIKKEQPTQEGKYVVKTITTMGSNHKVEARCFLDGKGKAHFGVTNQNVTHWLKEN